MAGKAASGKALQLMKVVLENFKKSPGFDKCMEKCELLDGELGRCVVLYKVQENHLNKFGTLHGGMGASLVDIVTTMALVTDSEDSLKKLGMSVDLNLTYLSPALPGEEILVDARALKIGKRLAFTECELRKRHNNQLVLKARHTKFVG